MTDSIDKKSNGKRDNPKVDLDAMLDEAESSLMPRDGVSEEDAIDSLVMDSGFNVDDEMERAAMRGNTSSNDDEHDELDDLLGFDNFIDDFKLEPVVPAHIPKEPEDEEDELDRLLMNVGLDLEEELAAEDKRDAQAFQDFDDFSDFGDFNNADTFPSNQDKTSEQAGKQLNSNPGEFTAPDESDEFAGLFSEDFNEADLIQDDADDADDAASAQETVQEAQPKPLPEEPIETASFDEEDFSDLFEDGFDDLAMIADEEAQLAPADEARQAREAVSDNYEPENESSADALEDDLDDADLVEEQAPTAAASMLEQPHGESEIHEAAAVDEEDELANLFGESFDASDLIQDEDVSSAPAVPAPDKDGAEALEQDEGSGHIDEEDYFSDFSDFNETNVELAAETDTDDDRPDSASDIDSNDEYDAAVPSADLPVDDFDESDLLQDDVSTITEAIQPELDEQYQPEAAEQQDDFSNFEQVNAADASGEEVESVSDLADTLSSSFSEADLIDDVSDVQSAEEVAVQELLVSPDDTTEVVVPGQEDEFVGLFGEGFDDLDVISDEETQAPATVESEQLDLPVSVADTQDDFDLLADSFEDSLDGADGEPTQAEIEATPIIEPDDEAASNETAELDDMDEFAGLFGEGFDGSDLISDEETQAPATVESEQPDLPVSVADTPDDFDLLADSFEDSLDGADGERTQAEIEATPIIEPDDEAASNETAELDDMDEFAGLFGEGFDDLDVIADEETQAPATVESEQPDLPVSEADTPDDSDQFADLFVGSLDETDWGQTHAEIAAAPAIEQSDDETEVNQAAKTDDETDEFAGLFADGFDDSDLLDDQAAQVIASGPNDEQPAIATPEILLGDEDAFDDLFPESAINAKDPLEIDPATDNLLAEGQEFPGLVDDFDDADLMQDEEENVSADWESLNDLQGDEEGFDSLFTDVGFDEEETPEQATAENGEFGDDSDFNDFFQLDGIGDDTTELADESQLAAADQSPSDEDEFLLSDFDITADTDMPGVDDNSEIKQDGFADAFGDSDFLNEDDTVQAFEPGATELKSVNEEAVAENEPKQAIGSEVENVENVQFAQFEFEQEEMRKQLEEADKKTKKAKLFGYLALGFGGVALSAAAGLGYMAYNAKSELAKLNTTIADLQTGAVKNVAPLPQEEINAMRNSVVQLNQQLNGFITELKGNPQFLVDLLNNKVPDIAAKQDMVSKALQVLQVKAGIEGGEPLEKAPVEPVKIDAAHQPELVKGEPASVKIESVDNKKDVTAEPELKVTIKPKPSINFDAAKSEVVQDASAPGKTKVKPEEPVSKPAKPATTPKVEAQEEPVQARRPEPVGKWGINLAAFKQEWFARSKAAEFARQGIFAEVVPVFEKNTAMYRLRVGGFKTKAEANANSARIKQTLNLDSVWVSDN